MRGMLLVFLLQAAAPQEREKWLTALKTVTLERGERTVKETLEAFRTQTGLPVEASGVDEAAKVTVEFKDRPVLQAMDDLCRALGKGSVDVRDETKGAGGTLILDGALDAPAAASHWKQFRLEVKGVQVTLTRSLQKVTRNVQVTLDLKGQPGMRPLAVGGFIVDEALDDTGWSLLAVDDERHRSSDDYEEGEDRDAVIFEERHGRRGMEQDLTVSLALPAKDAKAIERLRGRVPVTFPIEHLDRSIPVAELTEGKEIKIGGMLLRVTSFKQEGEKATFAYQSSGGGGRRSDFPSFPTFSLRDEKGESIGRGYSGSGSGDGYRMEYRLARAGAVVASIQYAAFVGRVTVMVPVDFRNVPLPTPKKG